MQTRLTLFCRIDALLLQEQLPCTCSLSHGHTDPCGGGLLACSGLQLGVGPLAYYAIGEPNTPLQTLTLQDLTRPAPLTDCRKVQRCRHPAAALPG